MTLDQTIQERVSNILGANYRVISTDAFNRNYTTMVQTPYGVMNDITAQAFEKDKGKIIVSVATVQTKDIATPYRAEFANYTLSFWVSIDDKIIKRFSPTENDFNFWDDVERLREALKQKIEIDGNTLIMTAGEARLASNVTDKTATGDRVSYQMTGSVSLIDSKLALGGSLEIIFTVTKEINSTIAVDGGADFTVYNPELDIYYAEESTTIDLYQGAKNLTFTYGEVEHSIEKGTSVLLSSVVVNSDTYTLRLQWTVDNKVTMVSRVETPDIKEVYLLGGSVDLKYLLTNDVKVDNAMDLSYTRTLSANQIVQQGRVDQLQTKAVGGYGLDFVVEDFSDNAITEFFRDVVFKGGIYEVPITIKKDGIFQSSFTGLISVTWSAADENSVGNYACVIAPKQ